MGNIIDAVKKKIGIDRWSLGMTVGFPMGISGTITVEFETEEKP